MGKPTIAAMAVPAKLTLIESPTISRKSLNQITDPVRRGAFNVDQASGPSFDNCVTCVTVTDWLVVT
jgi:hypothetical protein